MPDRLYQLLAASAVIGAIVGSCAGCVTARARVYTTEVQRDERAVAVVSGCGTEGHSGSGVIVDDLHVLTALHVVPCVGGESTITVTTPAGRKVPMRLQALQLQADVARLVPKDGSRFGLGPLPVARAFPGDRVCISPAAPERTMSCGTVDKVSSGPNGISHDAATIPGNSGSGLYDSRGRLVGIVTQRKHAGGGLATPLASRRWLVRP